MIRSRLKTKSDTTPFVKAGVEVTKKKNNHFVAIKETFWSPLFAAKKSRRKCQFPQRMHEATWYICFVALFICLTIPVLKGGLHQVNGGLHTNYAAPPRVVLVTHLHNNATRYRLIGRELESIFYQKTQNIQPEKDEPAGALAKNQIISKQSILLKNEDRCAYMHAWQETSFPSCNSIHEIDFYPTEKNFVYVNSGGTRATFRMFSKYFSVNGRDEGTMAFKIPKFTKEIGEKYIKRQQLDALGMERLSQSPYVTDIHGFCGVSMVTEYSDGGNLHDMVKSARLGGETLSSMDRLRVGLQIAQGVADTQTFEKDGRPSLAHHDICCHQFIFVDGVFKVNDFEGAVLLQIDQSKRKSQSNATQYCKRHPSKSKRKYGTPDQWNPDGYDVIAADVYSMGNVMYYVLTNKYIMEGYDRTIGVERLLKGERSSFPESIVENGHPAEVALMDAIKMCWVHDPLQRPSAKEVADFLAKKVFELEGNSATQDYHPVIRVTLPQRNKNQRMTDSDFWRNS